MMKHYPAKLFLVLVLITSCFALPAQKAKATAASKKQYPASFKISKTEFDDLISKKAKDPVKSKTNRYIDNSTVIINVLNGDTRFLKIKLSYFNTSFLTVQVNGVYTTQVFLLSDDKSVFYKGKLDSTGVTMTKCNQDDIVSE